MKKSVIFFMMFGSQTFVAQINEPIQADRPDQTETPAIVPRGMFQVETGFTFQKNDEISKTNTLPTALWKYGVNENFELRLITEFISEKIDENTQEGLAPIFIGFKVKLAEEKALFLKHLLLHILVSRMLLPQNTKLIFMPLNLDL